MRARSISSALGAWLIASALACEGTPPPTVAADAGDDAAAEDAAIEVPALDPARCPSPAPDADTGFARGALASHGALADKAYPALAALDDVAGLFDTPGPLRTLAAARKDRLTEAGACVDAACVVAKVGFSADEATAGAAALVDALGARAEALATELRKAGVVAPFGGKPTPELLRAAYADALLATTKGLGGYATPAVAKEAAAALGAATPTLHGPLVAVLARGLAAAGRDEATRYEPLALGENKAALAAIAGVRFADYPFSAIVVPGLGPVSLDAALSEGGRLRCDLAKARFDKKLAPLLLVSGGHVHPDRTPYSEALEMKKYLRSLGVPDAAILVDPHARHTTTNLRNAARILLRAGVPADRPLLVTTDLGQTLYMSGTGFPKRCREELGYEPWRAFGGLSAFDTCMSPSTRSLYPDPRDPLDP